MTYIGALMRFITRPQSVVDIFLYYTAVKYRCLSIKNQSRGTKKGWNSLLFKRKVWYGNPSTVDAAAGDTSIIP